MADLLKLKPGQRANRILVKHLSTVPNVVKDNLVLFNNRLVAEALVSQRAYDPQNRIYSSLESATALYQACMTTVENDPSKFSTLMDVLIEYPTLEGAVEEMKETAVQAELIAMRQEVPHGGARQRQRAAELSEVQSVAMRDSNVTMRDSSSVSGGFVGGQVTIQQFTVYQQPQGSSAKVTPGLKQTAPEAILTISEMKAVMEELQGFADWKEFGRNLGVDQGHLNIIEDDASKNYGRLSKVIEHWLKRNHDEEKCGPPTWGNLAKAMKPIDKARALNIEEKYCISSGTGDPQPTAKQPMQPPPSIPDEPMHVDEKQPVQQPPNAASSGQQTQLPSTPEKSSPAPKGKPLPEALDISHLRALKKTLRGLTDWQGLGLELEMEYSFLDSIDKDKAGDVEKCKTAMLNEWLKTGNATKSSLMEALREMGEDSIADKLQ